jgi:hypothetical protein
MGLPLLTMTFGLGLLPWLVAKWNVWSVPEGLLQVIAWLLGIGAATLCKYVIQLALVTAAWDAVVQLPADEPEPAASAEGMSTRDDFFSWKLPPDNTATARLARRNGSPS